MSCSIWAAVACPGPLLFLGALDLRTAARGCACCGRGAPFCRRPALLDSFDPMMTDGREMEVMNGETERGQQEDKRCETVCRNGRETQNRSSSSCSTICCRRRLCVVAEERKERKETEFGNSRRGIPKLFPAAKQEGTTDTTRFATHTHTHTAHRQNIACLLTMY